MSVKSLTTSLATAALVGAIGLAYAQSSSDPAAPPVDTTTQAQPAPATTMPPSSTLPSDGAAVPTDGSTTASPSSADPSPSSTMAEPAPQADRG